MAQLSANRSQKIVGSKVLSCNENAMGKYNGKCSTEMFAPLIKVVCLQADLYLKIDSMTF